MAYNCDPNALLIASKCFLDPNIGVEQRKAIELHARVKELQALGGANYAGNISALMLAAAKWRLMMNNQREAISTYRTVQDSVTNGSGIATDINSLKKASSCYLAIGSEDKKNLLAFLSCSIGVFNKSDGGDGGE